MKQEVSMSEINTQNAEAEDQQLQEENQLLAKEIHQEDLERQEDGGKAQSVRKILEEVEDLLEEIELPDFDDEEDRRDFVKLMLYKKRRAYEEAKTYREQKEELEKQMSEKEQELKELVESWFQQMKEENPSLFKQSQQQQQPQRPLATTGAPPQPASGSVAKQQQYGGLGKVSKTQNEVKQRDAEFLSFMQAEGLS